MKHLDLLKPAINKAWAEAVEFELENRLVGDLDNYINCLTIPVCVFSDAAFDLKWISKRQQFFETG
jgi:hypothetical protein